MFSLVNTRPTCFLYMEPWKSLYLFPIAMYWAKNSIFSYFITTLENDSFRGISHNPQLDPHTLSPLPLPVLTNALYGKWTKRKLNLTNYSYFHERICFFIFKVNPLVIVSRYTTSVMFRVCLSRYILALTFQIVSGLCFGLVSNYLIININKGCSRILAHF